MPVLTRGVCTTATAPAMTGSIKLRDYPGDMVRLECDRRRIRG